jgi:multiple sugar transport system substrate-binding protein
MHVASVGSGRRGYRRSIKRRGLVTGAIAATAAVTLSACGSSSPTSAHSSSPTTAAPSTSKRIVLTAWDQYTASAGTAIAKQAAAFNASQSKYHVNLDFITAKGSLFTPKLLTALSSHTGPNLVLGYTEPQDMAEVAKTGQVVVLNSYMNSSLSRPASSFFPAMMKASTFGGKVYSLPTDGGDYAIFYNKKLFAKAGITSTPMTWAQLTSDAKRLTGHGVYGFYVPFGTNEWTVWTWESLLWAEGGHFLNSKGTKVAFDSSAGVAALNVWLKMLKQHVAYPSSLANSTSNSGYEGFEAGKVAMYIDGSYDLAEDDASLGTANVGVFAFPKIKEYAMNTGTNQSFMLKGTKAQQQGEWEYLHFMTEPSVQAKWDVATGFVPTVKAVVDTPGYKKMVASDPRLNVFVEELKYAHTRPSISSYAQISLDIGQQLESAFLGRESAAKAMSTAGSEAQAALSANG